MAGFLDSYGRTPAVLVGLTLLVLVLGVALAWGRRRRASRRAPVPSGGGAALTLALDGDLDGARTLLEEAVRSGGPGRDDALLGLVAVLREQGAVERAENLLDVLARRGGTRWLGSARVRLALDRGDVEAAAEAAIASELPLTHQLAALLRAGRAADALRCYASAVARKARDPEMLAALEAAGAAEAWRQGRHRGARRRLKRAAQAAPENLLVMAVSAMLHPKAAERTRFEARLAARLSPGQGNPGELSGISYPELEALLR